MTGLRTRARWTQILLLLSIAATGFVLWSHIDEIRTLVLFPQLQAAFPDLFPDLPMDRDPHFMVQLISQFIYTACSIAFLLWFHRAYSCLQVAGIAGLRYSPRWAVLGFIIPVMCFYRPFQVMKELWQRSVLREKNAGNATVFVYWWWGFFLSWQLLWLVAGIQNLIADTLHDKLMYEYYSSASLLSCIAAAYFTIRLVRQVSANLFAAAGNPP